MASANRDEPDMARGIGMVDRQPQFGTGDPNKDRALGRALVRISQMFEERPSFGFVDDAEQPNAFATDEPGRVPGTWGVVLLGTNLFRQLLDRFDDGGMAVTMVLAHEFGHIAQYHRKAYNGLIGAARRSKRAELHADLLAGYYLGRRKADEPRLTLRLAGVSLFQIGDFQFNSKDHHGTPEERVDAAERGFTMARAEKSFSDAFADGRDWILERYSQ
jgi:hypothetical protein